MVKNKFNNTKGGGKGRNAPQVHNVFRPKQFPIPSRDQGGGRRGQTTKLMPQPKGKAFGKGKGKAGQRQGQKGQAQGKAGRPTMDDKFKEKIKAVDHSLKLWVGGLSDKTGWKAIEKHFEQYATKPDIVDMMKKGTACISYKTEEEVLGAIASLNATELDGKTIEVDEWTKPDFSERREKRKEGKKNEDGEGEDGEKRRNRGGKKNKKEAPVKGKQVIQGGKFAKNSKRSEQDRKKLEKMDHACKVWVGGLPDEVSVKEVIGFFELVGKPKVTDIRRKGTACVAFASEADALNAISTLNGSDLKGSTIQVDEWTKPDRSERRGKKGKDDDDA